MNNEINSANLHKMQQRLDAMQNQIDALNNEIDNAQDYIYALNALVHELMRTIPVGLAGAVASNLDKNLQTLPIEQRRSPGMLMFAFWCDELFRVHGQLSPAESAFHYDE
jgi:hypothetical protein